MFPPPPPPYEPIYASPPAYENDLELKEKQREIIQMMAALRATNEAHLSSTTEKTIQNIMYIFEHRFTQLEKELMEQIHHSHKWLQDLPIYEKEHAEVKAKVNDLYLSVQQLEKIFVTQEQVEKLVVARVRNIEERLFQLEMKQVDEKKNDVDRWTDPRNGNCRLQTTPFDRGFGQRFDPFNFPYLKPLPPFIKLDNLSNFNNSYKIFLLLHINEYICPCYNCFLVGKYQLLFMGFNTSSDPPISGGGIRLCPRDTECTCLTLIHRIMFLHSIGEVESEEEVKGRDKELAYSQILYCKSFGFRNSNNYGFNNNNPVTIKIPDQVNENQIVNTFVRNGIVIYEYYNSSIFKFFQTYLQTTEENLYVLVVNDGFKSLNLRDMKWVHFTEVIHPKVNNEGTKRKKSRKRKCKKARTTRRKCKT